MKKYFYILLLIFIQLPLIQLSLFSQQLPDGNDGDKNKKAKVVPNKENNPSNQEKTSKELNAVPNENDPDATDLDNADPDNTDQGKIGNKEKKDDKKPTTKEKKKFVDLNHDGIDDNKQKIGKNKGNDFKPKERLKDKFIDQDGDGINDKRCNGMGIGKRKCGACGKKGGTRK